MAEWKNHKLGDFVEIQTGPFGSQLHAHDYVAIGTPSIMPTNIGQRLDVLMDEIACVSDKDIERLKRYVVKPGDIVYSRRGDVEKCAYMTEEQNGWLCGGGCLRIRVVKNALDSKFCAYYLSTRESRSWILNSAVGSTMPNLNSSILLNFPIAVPEVPEQKAIAEVLSSLDDKIDLLHRQNRTLESLAETLFRQWFIEEAKNDWEEKSLFDLIELVGGGTPKTEVAEYWDGDIRWISGKDVTPNHKQFILNTEKKITEVGMENSSAKYLTKFSTIITARGTVGNYCLLSEDMAFSQSNYGIKPKVENCYFFTFLLIANAVDELKSAAYGSVFDTITTNTFKEHRLSVPSEVDIKLFEQKISSYFEKMLANSKQIASLSKTRDSLLPQLMNGNVSIRK